MVDKLELVATLEDKTRAALQEMAKNFQQTSDIAKKANIAHTKVVRENALAYKELHEGVSKAKNFISGAFTPALAALGLTTYGVGETLGKMVENLKKAGESYHVLNDATRRSGTSAGYVVSLTVAMERLGIAAGSVPGYVGSMGDSLAKLQRGTDSTFMNALTGTFRDMLPFIKEATKGLTTNEERVTALLRVASQHPEIPVDKWMKFYEAIGGPASLATKNKAEVDEALRSGADYLAKHPPDIELYGRLDTAFTKLKETLNGLGDDITKTFGPAGVTLIEKFAAAIAKLDATAVKSKIDNRSIFGRALDALGLQTTTATGVGGIAGAGAGASFKDRFDAIKKPVTEGVVQGLRDFSASNSAASAFAGGLSPMAYHPSEGGGGTGRGGLHSGGGYTVLPEGGGQGGMLAPGAAGGAPGGGQGGMIPSDAGAGTKSYATGGGIDRSKWLAELQANPRLKDELYRRSLGENTHPMANQAIMEEAANRADIRGNKGFADHSNLTYFQGRFGGRITPSMQKMLDANFDKVFRQGSDVSGGAIDNSSQGLAYVHEHGGQSGQYGRPGLPPGRFKTTANFGGDQITGHRGVESFEVPGWGESGSGERAAWPAFRANQLEQMRGHGARLRDHIRGKGRNEDADALSKGMKGVDAGTNHNLDINLNGFPRGTKTAYKGDQGLFKEVKLNRGRPMAPASQDS